MVTSLDSSGGFTRSLDSIAHLLTERKRDLSSTSSEPGILEEVGGGLAAIEEREAAVLSA